MQNPRTRNRWICGKCGRENPMEYNFCPDCGEKRTTVALCPSCGRELPKEETPAFCPWCGVRLTRPRPRGPWPPQRLYGCPEAVEPERDLPDRKRVRMVSRDA